MTDLVLVKKQNKEDVPVTTSKIVADGTKIQHHSITKSIQTYEKDFLELGILRFEIEEIKGRGQPEKLYYLNEDQFLLLVTYLRNNDVVRKLKIALIKEFSAMKKFLLQKESQEWQESRKLDKSHQAELNDTIKNFVDYAISQGSSSATKYYTHFAKLSNSVIGIEDGSRDMSDYRTLFMQTLVFDAIKRTIEEEMQKGTPYKKIYTISKEKSLSLMSQIIKR